MRTIRYCLAMPPEGSVSILGGVVSRREARLVFWLVLIALVAFILSMSTELFAIFASPAIILFVAWLMSYVLEPPVSWVQRHLPFKGRGVAVGLTYLVTAVVAFAVIASAAVAIIQAASSFVENLPQILEEVGAALAPLVDFLGLTLPSGESIVTAVQRFLAENAAQLADAVTAIVRNAVVVVGSLITAVIISVGLAMGQVSLLGWMRRFLPSSTYRDLTELERAIAVSFGGFVRGRLVIGAIYGAVVGIGALLLGIPYAPLIAVIAGLIVFIPWIGPLIGWIVLPAFASLLAPTEVVPALIISVIGAVAIQLVVTQFVMAGAVKMTPVAVFVVVILGTAVAGIMGAIFAIPTAAAILAVTDYLRERDVLLRATDAAEAEATAARLPGDGPPAADGDAPSGTGPSVTPRIAGSEEA